LDVAGIEAHGKEPEEGAENVFSLGDPRYRFDMEGMKREERRDERTRPKKAGHPAKDQEQEQGIGDVKNEA